MAVYTTYTVKPQYYSGSIPGCLNGGEDYRTVEAGKTIVDMNLAVDAGLKGFSNACSITSMKMSCQYRVTNTSNGSGLTLKGKFTWIPLYVRNPSLSGTSINLNSGGQFPDNCYVLHGEDEHLIIDNERKGNTSYASYSYTTNGNLYANYSTFFIVGGKFVFVSGNSISACRMWLKDVSFTLTRTRACYIHFNPLLPHDQPGAIIGKRIWNYGEIPYYTPDDIYPELTSPHHDFIGWVDADDPNRDTPNEVIYTTLPAAGEHDVLYAGRWAPKKYVITVSEATNGNVTGAGTYDYGTTATLTATPDWGYDFVKWSDGDTSNPRTITISGNATYTAVFEKSIYNVNFRNIDGSIYSTSKIVHGSTLGTIPTPTRSGYEFAGWLPCAPAKDLYGNVLDSRYYGGLTSYPLAQDYKYKDKFALHIEAHKTDWSDIKPRDNKPGEQIISCTEGGGWGLGYQAGSETAGRGAEIYSSSGYKIIDFGYENFVNNSWYAFDLVFNNGTFEAYVNGEKRGSVSIGTSTLTYNSSNTIFVGAEAGGNTETPAGNYFNGTISNVFITNKGERLTQPTSELVIYNQMDFYPIWRKLPTYKAEFLNYDKSLLHTSIQSQGSTPTYTGPTPTKPSDDDYEYEFSGWEPKLGPITNDTSYIAQFKGIKNKYNLFVSTQGGGQSDKEGVTQGIDYGTEITITAIPDVGYRFVEWGDGNSENPRTFKLKGDTFLYPIFEKDFFSVELIDGQVDLVVSGQEKEGKYEYYSDLKISPIKKPGYKFTHWTGEVEEFQGEYFIRVLSDMKIVANYQELNMVFKSVKICYPTENDIVSLDNPVLGGDRVYLEIQVALE